MREYRFYCRRTIRSERWRIYLATPAFLASQRSGVLMIRRDETIAGITAYATRQVFADVSETDYEQRRVIGHELVHVMAGESPEGLPIRYEEAAAMALEPHIIGLIEAFGGRLPAKSQSLLAFEREHRKAYR